jgi:hypothetical protein
MGILKRVPKQQQSNPGNSHLVTATAMATATATATATVTVTVTALD